MSNIFYDKRKEEFEDKILISTIQQDVLHEKHLRQPSGGDGTLSFKVPLAREQIARVQLVIGKCKVTLN